MNRKIIIGSACGILLIAAIVILIALPPQISRHSPYSNGVAVIEVGLERYLTDNGKLPPSSENHVVVDVLSGNNPEKTKYVDFKKADLNQSGEIVDYWKTPLKIIFNSDQSFSIRSAGPDRIFGTEDDAQFD